MSRRKKTLFEESLILNTHSFQYYVDRLTELSISMFEWKNIPDTIDIRYVELQLFLAGNVVYFRDEVVGDLCLNCLIQGQLDVYGYPIRRRAYSMYNNYQKDLDRDNSVIIWNNFLHKNTAPMVQDYARRLGALDRIIDTNVNAQKTPVLVQGTEKQRLTLKNLYKEFDGNAPFIFGDKSLDLNALKVLKTDAPYVADKIYELKTQYWNEALTYLGIANINVQKKERMITDEVTRNQGGTIASRYSRLESRRQAVEKINEMFGTDIEVNYREDYQLSEKVQDDTLDGEGGEDYE